MCTKGMFKTQVSHLGPRGRRAFLALAATLLSFVIAVPAAAQHSGYWNYYVLGYEEHVWQAFLAINDADPDPAGLLAGRICSTVSIVATANYQIVYYDHWEDGYEDDLTQPDQLTTRVYGDGDPSNGGSGSDILTFGDTINLTSDQDITGSTVITGYVSVSPARDPDDLRYDGGDHILASGGPVNLTHAMWPLGNSWVGGAWEVYSRQAYADAYSYRLPVGEDLYVLGGGDNGAYGDFRDVYLQLEAFEEDRTDVSISNDTGTIDFTLLQGQTYSSMGYINSSEAPSITLEAGTIIRASGPVQVGLMTGADGTFQGRFLIVLPDQLWGADYVVPVPSGGLGDEAEVYLSNPNDFEITINAYDVETQTTFVISPTGHFSMTIPYSLTRGGAGYVPQGSAARFTSSNGDFGVVVCADTSDTEYDWGFSAIPAKYLARDYYASWSPGNSCTPPNDPSCDGDPDTPGIQPAVNGSPVWVTPLADGTTFHVDFSPLDNVVDDTFILDVLEQRRIFDPDNDNTGMHIWASSEFAIAWGEDPTAAGIGTPYLDLGSSILPPRHQWLEPVLTLDKTVAPTVLSPSGGTVTFTLVAQSYAAPVTHVDISDTLPIGWTYVPNSARVTYPDRSTEDPVPVIDDRELFWDLSTDLGLNEGLTLTFQAQITNTGGVSVSVNWGEAIGRHLYSDVLLNPGDEASVYISSLKLVKSVSNAQARIGDTLVYTLSYTNLSTSTTATGVKVYDPVPIQHVTFLSASSGYSYSLASGTVAWKLGPLAPRANGIVTYTAKVNDFVEDGTVIANAGYISGDQTPKAGSSTARTSVLAPKVRFTKAGPTVAPRGEVITYTLSYENVGREEATEVIISDTIPLSTTYVGGTLAISTGAGWVSLTDASDGDQGAYVTPTLVITPGIVPGTVAAGESGQIRYSVQLDGDLQNGSVIRNWATLDRRLDIPRDTNLAVTRIADLLITKAAKQTVVAPGDVISYTLTYWNASGTYTHTDVYVQEAIPARSRFITGTAFGGDEIWYSHDYGVTYSTTLPITPVTHLRWYDAQVPTGTLYAAGFAVRVDDPLPANTTIRNIALISSTQSVYMPGWIPSNRVKVATVDLWVDKGVSQAETRHGDVVSYTISYGNRGSAAADDVRILDIIPNGTAYETGSIWGAGADASGAPDLVWDVGTVAVAAAQQVGYAVTVNLGLPPAAVVTNTAIISSAWEIQMSEPVTVTVTAEAELAIDKVSSSDAVRPGEFVTYTLRFSNTGTYTATGVVITDVVPVSVTSATVISSSVTITDTGASPPYVWAVQDLGPGARGIITMTGVLSIGLPVGHTFINTATITGTYDVDSANNRSAVSVTVENAPPVALDDSYTTTEEIPLDVFAPAGVLDNDTDANGDPLAAVLGADVLTGSLDFHPDGSFAYTPTLDFYGVVTFSYQATDTRASSSLATVTITVTNVNDPPVADSDAFAVTEDSADNMLDVLDGDSDIDGDTLSVFAVGTTDQGGVALNAGTHVTYTPAADFFGTETFTYTVSDGNGGLDSATVTVTVTNVNDPPVADNDGFNVMEDSVDNVLDVLDGDSDIDGDTLTVFAVGTTDQGGVALNAGTHVTYTPAADFFGTETFTYTVGDGNGGFDSATVTVTITNVNTPPVADSDAFTVTEDSVDNVLDVLDGDSDIDGDTLTVFAVSAPDQGGVALNAGTHVTYTPVADFFGTETFTYTVGDGNGGLDSATVTVMVTSVNDPPVGDSDAFTVTEDSVDNVLDVLDGDSDIDGDTLTVFAVGTTDQGGVALNAGTHVTYTPAADFFGTETFTYTVGDGNGGFDSATVMVTVTNLNDPPTISDIPDQTTSAGTPVGPLFFTVGDLETPPGNLSLSAASSNPALVPSANLALGGSGISRTITVTPTSGQTGSAVITITVSDGDATAWDTFRLMAGPHYIYLPLVFRFFP